MAFRYTLIAAVCALLAMPMANAQYGNIDLSGDLMLMWFFSDNTYDFNDDGMTYYEYEYSGDDEQNFFRQEGHLFFDVNELGGDNVMVRIGLEVDRALEGGSAWGLRKGPTGDMLNSEREDGFGYENDPGLDVFVEEAYLKIAQIYDSAVTLTAGRQFINLGDDPKSEEEFNTWWGGSFVLGDAAWFAQSNLGDLGTWEIDPFDALRADIDLDGGMITLGAFKVDETFTLQDDTTGYFVYGSLTGMESWQLDGYWIFTDMDAFTGEYVDGYPLGNVEQHVVGLRAAGDIFDTLAGKVEVAYNWIETSGDFPSERYLEEDPDGFGLEAGLNWHPDVDYNPDLGFVFVWLEGDFDSDGSIDGAFIRPYTAKTYGEIMDMFTVTNRMIFGLNGGMDINEAWRVDAALWYMLADADEEFPDDSGDGDDDVGLELDAYLSYQFNEEISTQFGGGVVFPGDAIENVYEKDDEAYFLRGMVKVEF